MANVNVTYEEMRQAGTRLNSGREELTQRLNELQNMVNQLVNGGYVTDTSSKQFESSYQDFTQGATRVIEGLEGMSQYLNQAANTFEQADQSLAQSLNR